MKVNKSALESVVRDQTEPARLPAEELEALRQIALDITSQLDRERLLQTIIQRAVELLHAKGGGIYEYDPDQGELTVVADWGGRRSIVGNRLKVGEGMAGRVVETGKPLIVDDYGTWPSRASVYEPDLFPAVVEVPLRWEERILGVLYVADDAEGRVFTQRDADLLGLLASQAAIAIENTRLLEEARRRTQALEALHRTSLDITSYQRAPDLLKSILERAVEFLRAKGGGLYLLDESGKRVKLAAVSNLSEDLLGVTLEVGDSVVGHVIKTKTALSVSDYRSWPHRLRQFDEYDFTAVAGAPIAWQDKSWGAIAVHDDVEGRGFTQEDLDFLSHLGNLAAVALENARQTGELERLMASAIDAIVVVDERGKVVKFNEQAETILGYRGEEVLGQPVGPLYYDLEEAKKVKRLLLASKDGRITDHDTFVRTKDREKVPIRLSASLLFDYEGKWAGSVGFFRDLREIESAHRQIKQLTGLLEAGQAITELRDLPGVLQSIVDNARTALNVDAITLHLYDPDRDEFQAPPIATGVVQEDTSGGLGSKASVVARMVQVGRPHFADDAILDPLLTGEFVQREGIKSSAACPLKARDKVVGVMFFNYRQPHYFTEGEKTTINIFANQAAIAIENARLYEEVRQRAEQFQALYQASLSLSAELSLDAVLQNVVDLSRELVGAEYGTLGVLDEAGEFEHFLTSGLTEEKARIDSLPYRQGLLDVLLREGVSLRIPDISKDPRAVGFPSHQAHMHNLLGVPLFFKGRIIGGLWLTDKQEALEFTQEDQALLEMLATEIAITIVNARLYDETTQRLAESQALQQVGISLTETLELHAVLDRVMQAAIQLTEADEGSILLYDEQRGEFTDALTSPGLGQSLQPYQFQVRQRGGIAHAIVQQGQPVVIPDTHLDPRVSSVSIKKGRRAVVGVPLQGREGAIGVLYVSWKVPRHFSAQEVGLLTALASQAAVAIENARLYEETRRRLEEQTLLYKVAIAASSALELDKVLQATADSIAESLGYESVGIHLIDQTTQELIGPVYYAGLQPSYINISREIGIQGRVVRTGEAALVGDVSKDSDYEPANPDTKSELCVPLLLGERAIGIINAESTRVDAFAEHDLRLMETIAGQVANLIENARLYTQLDKTKETLAARTAVAWMGMVSSTWAHKTRGYAQTIKNYIELLRPVVVESAADREVLEKLDRMYAEAVKIQEIPLAAPLSTEEGIDNVDLNALLRERASRLLGPYKGSIALELKLDSVNSTEVRANRLWLMRVFDILIDNAIDAMSGSEVKTLTISTDAAGNSVKVHVVDTGGGVPPAVRPLLFKEPVPRSEGESGSGMGLLLASTIIQTYGGDIALGSTGPAGTTTIVSLPKSHHLFQQARKSSLMFSSEQRVLLISDDKAWQEVLLEALGPLGEVVVAQDEEKGLEHVRRAMSKGQPYRFLLVDLNATGNLQDLVARILAEQPNARVVVASAAPTWHHAREALQAGAIDFINKTLNKEELLSIFRNALMKTPPGGGEEGGCTNE